MDGRKNEIVAFGGGGGGKGDLRAFNEFGRNLLKVERVFHFYLKGKQLPPTVYDSTYSLNNKV